MTAVSLGYALCHFQILSKIGYLFHTPKISVVMSTYNRAETMSDSIDSVLAQTEPDFEFIIIDDGSTDNTFEILQQYAKKDRRIKVLRNDRNRGLIYSLNRGLDTAHGTFIARIDDDDTMLPWRLERQLLTMTLYPQVTILGTRITNEEAQIGKRTTLPMIENPDLTEINSYTSSALAHPTIMIRRNFIEKHHIRYRDDNLYAEDCGFYADVLNAGGKISTLEEHLLRYGVKKGVKKPQNYGHTQYNTYKKIQKEKLSRLFNDVDETLLGHGRDILTKCKIWEKMHIANADKNIVNQSVLEGEIQKHCPQDLESSILVKHKFWDDFFVFDGPNRVYRYTNKDAATIIKNTPDTLVVKWDKYGTEIFKKENDHLYTFVTEETK